MYRKPEKPVENKTAYLFNELCSAGDRFHRFPNEESASYDPEEEKDDPRQTHRVISLSEVDDYLLKQNIPRKDVFFTVSVADDYLVLQVMEIRPLTYQEQLDEYEEDMKEWDIQQAEDEKREMESIEREMKSLQKKADRLKSKKKSVI